MAYLAVFYSFDAYRFTSSSFMFARDRTAHICPCVIHEIILHTCRRVLRFQIKCARSADFYIIHQIRQSLGMSLSRLNTAHLQGKCKSHFFIYLVRQLNKDLQSRITVIATQRNKDSYVVVAIAGPKFLKPWTK